MKADILVFAVHPDDAELACSGTIRSLVHSGKKVVIADLTKGEMGTRGTIETRKKEAEDSAKILGLSDRVQLNLADTAFENNRNSQTPLIETIRRFQPDIVICNALEDRHPDHGRSAKLEADACFYSGLKMIETIWNGQKQEAWRPRLVFHYIQDILSKPDFVVDISDYWETKLACIKAFKTQFYDPESTEPETYISTPLFLEFLESRSKEFGHMIGVKYGEGFHSARTLGISDLSLLK